MNMRGISNLPFDPALPVRGANLTEQLIIASRNIALTGTLDGAGENPEFAWPWFYIVANELLLAELIAVSLIGRRALLTLLDDAGKNETIVNWRNSLPPVLIEHFSRSTSLKLKTLATGFPGWMSERGLISGTDVAKRPPWLGDVSDFFKLKNCLETLNGEYRSVIGAERMPGRILSLASVAAFRPEVLHATSEFQCLRCGPVLRCAVACETVDLNEIAAFARAEAIASQAVCLWNVVSADEAIQKLLQIWKLPKANDPKNPLYALGASLNPSTLYQAHALVLRLFENTKVFYPQIWDKRWGPTCSKFLNTLRLAGKSGVPGPKLKKDLRKSPSVLIQEMLRQSKDETRSPMQNDKAIVAKLIQKLRNLHNDGRYYLYQDSGY